MPSRYLAATVMDMIPAECDLCLSRSIAAEVKLTVFRNMKFSRVRAPALPSAMARTGRAEPMISVNALMKLLETSGCEHFLCGRSISGAVDHSRCFNNSEFEPKLLV